MGFSDLRVGDESIFSFASSKYRCTSIRVLLDSLKFYKKEMQPAAILCCSSSFLVSVTPIAFGNAVDMTAGAQIR